MLLSKMSDQSFASHRGDNLSARGANLCQFSSPLRRHLGQAHSRLPVRSEARDIHIEFDDVVARSSVAKLLASLLYKYRACALSTQLSQHQS